MKVNFEKYKKSTVGKKRKLATCRCGCGLDAVDLELDGLLMETGHTICELLSIESSNLVLYITSWNRCKSHNFKVGGAVNSAHVHCRAVDVVFAFIKEKREHLVDHTVVVNAVNSTGITCELGIYDKGRVHVAVGETGFFDKRSK